MFGVSFTELLLIGAVTLMVVGPDRLPKMLGTLGRWSAKLRRLTSEVRYQSGIDDLLRKEGITGGLNELRELRNVARGDFSSLGKQAMARPRPNASPRQTSTAPASASASGSGVSTAAANPATPNAAAPTTGQASPPSHGPQEDPFADVPYDRSQEYPAEGCDAYGALPDDLWEDPQKAAPAATATATSSIATPASAAGSAPTPAPGNVPKPGEPRPQSPEASGGFADASVDDPSPAQVKR